MGYSRDACGGLCPYAAPFCFRGRCVVPSCAEHAAHFCQNESITGVRFRQASSPSNLPRNRAPLPSMFRL